MSDAPWPLSLAILREASGATAQFLQPQIGAEETTFKLTEGVFVAQKATTVLKYQ